MKEFDEVMVESSLFKLSNTDNFGIITKAVRNNTTTLYSSVIDISLQKKQGQLGAVFVGTRDEDFENLRVIKKIGQGGFSEVFQAVHDESKKEYAMRLCQIDEKHFTQARALKEIDVYIQLQLIDHPNIARVHYAKIISSTFEDQQNLSLQVVMELGVCTLEDVFKHRTKNAKPWAEIELLHISYMLISALQAAKARGISHRDISLNNIILSKDLKNYKLIDFAEVYTQLLGQNGFAND